MPNPMQPGAGQSDASIIDRIAASVLGPGAAAPGGAPVPGGPAPQPGASQPGAPDPSMQQQAMQQQAPAAPARETQEAAAQTAMAPNDATNQSPVVFNLPGKDGKPGRSFTASQIEGMADRYSSLNYEHQQMKPIIEFAKQMMAQNPNMKPQDLIDAVVSMSKAQEHSPQIGDRARAQTAQQQGLPYNDPYDDAALSKWEEDNATTLPPGYRQFMQMTQGMQSALGQQHGMLQQLLANSQGVAEGARMAVQTSQQQMVDARKMQIASNLDRAQTALNLPDDAAHDFMSWAGERGYSLEDFIDPQMTTKVMTDFRNGILSGEVQRLQRAAQNRTAFTGNIGQQPGAAGGAQGEQPASDFEQFANRMMAKRGL